MNAVPAVLVRLTLASLLLAGPSALLAQEAGAGSGTELSMESILWRSVKDGGDTDRIRRFLKAYPDGQFADQARALLAPAEKPPTDEVLGGEAQAASGDAIVSAPTVVSADGPAPAFDEPVAGDMEAPTPRSLAELVQDSPAFAPIEELDPDYWVEQTCSNCHEWSPAALCTQGEFYVASDETAITRIQHPYGGFFKRAVKRWAADGCP